MTESPRGLPVKESIRIKSIRKVMAQSMKASVDNAALSQLSREIDVTDLQSLRKAHVSQTDRAISLNTLIMFAVARTLPQHPMLNAELVEREILVYNTVNLGMAVATDGGLVVPVIAGADSLSLSELVSDIDKLTERTRNNQLSITDVEGGTFTVSNLGMYGIDSGFPIPRPPEGAILLVGAAKAKPVVINYEVVVRQLAGFSITYDHRYIDGATAADFLKNLNELITQPESLMA